VSRNGILYHEREFKQPVNFFTFNAVKSGEYTFTQPVQKSETAPIKKLSTAGIFLPNKERFYKADFYIVKNDNYDGKARMYKETGEIQTGRLFEQYNEQIKEFIILHEIGHFFYSTEWKCDLYALMQYLKKGYNQSQAYSALSKVLYKSPENLQRIQLIKNQLIKIDK
jgi:hypothetical protein